MLTGATCPLVTPQWLFIYHFQWGIVGAPLATSLTRFGPPPQTPDPCPCPHPLKPHARAPVARPRQMISAAPSDKAHVRFTRVPVSSDGTCGSHRSARAGPGHIHLPGTIELGRLADIGRPGMASLQGRDYARGCWVGDGGAGVLGASGDRGAGFICRRPHPQREQRGAQVCSSIGGPLLPCK